MRFLPLAVTLITLSATHAAAQIAPPRRPATDAEVILGNVLIGGLTAVTRAAISGKNPFTAFSLGALGGAVHVAGKHLTVEPGPVNGWLGLAVASTGTSIVGNAGRGVSPLQELTLPILSARVLWKPGEAQRVRIVVNGYESVLIASAFMTRDLRIDWSETASSGAAVFRTERSDIVIDDYEYGGLAWGPVVVIGKRAFDPGSVLRHELIHVQQNWFVAEAWDRPIEDALRAKLPGGRFVPSWLQLGVISLGIMAADDGLFGERGLAALLQAEAERLERR
ncbi:MAG: hypothetical protein ACRENU_08960 [Gemmatimonadaceae bacterium]